MVFSKPHFGKKNPRDLLPFIVTLPGIPVLELHTSWSRPCPETFMETVHGKKLAEHPDFFRTSISLIGRSDWPES